MIDKLRDCFDEMIVYKDLQNSNFFSSLSLPSFLRDWLLKQFQDENGDFDIQEVSEFIKAHIPDKKDWVSIKDRIIIEHEKVKILTKITVDIDIKTEEISFSLPDYGLTNKETVIESRVWSSVRSELVNGQETWGIIELGYRPPDDYAKPKIPGKIKLLDFINFCPYEIDLEYFKDVRSEFTVAEWIDILLGAIDYNADAYEDETQKLAMLSRLLPFVEKRLNLFELAPKGTGKTYVFGNISKFGFLTDGGKVTRAKMFYDSSRRIPGFIMGNDYVAIDEVKLVQFSDVNEMRSIMQGYMERGTFNFGGYEGKSDAGVIFLGNIEQINMDEYSNMLTELPELFKESALVDRMHGFIKGWDIPPMTNNLKMTGWALNTEYFCSIMHELRSDVSYRSIVDRLVNVDGSAYIRHTEAVKRIATAFLKLLFPNVRTPKDISVNDFQRYCLRPAVKMRKIIWQQLAIIDTAEYQKENKLMPVFTVKDLSDEE
ncbi:MAG: BREX system Lon protease-like protein BrxL [Clostridia bacterium]|nr:BREX system Lon protease-like protein BrxL [Clostridia bacterium]